MTETGVFGGGCFWCLEPIFSGIHGVQRVLPGYAGGTTEHPSYEEVCTQNNGHIEVIQIQFDPTLVTYEQLVMVFFAVHDPTTVDRQGNDVGPQYASVIFCQTAAQKEVVQQCIRRVAYDLGQLVVTQVRDAERFWPAEPIHHNYYARHPEQGYCQYVITPKVTAFRQHFAQLLVGNDDKAGR